MNTTRFPSPVVVCALVALTFSAAAPLLAQSQTLKDEPLLSVAGEKYTVDDIASAYQSNAVEGDDSFYTLKRDSAMAFLNLYANFRMKVNEALRLGLDKDSELVQEMHSNRVRVTVPPGPGDVYQGDGYLIEREVVDPAVEEIWKRRQEELYMALMFIGSKTRHADDSARLYPIAANAISRLKAGESMHTIALSLGMSDSTLHVTADTTWITGGMLFPDVETYAYALPVGQVHDTPIPVKGGFVIEQMLDRQPRVRVRGAHILITAPNDSNDADARARAEAALARIRSGEDFAAVARDVSEDKATAQQGGDLISYYTRSLGFESRNGKLVPPFEKALFSLKDGEVSDVIHTRFGYHIIKRLDTKPIVRSEEEPTIRQIYRQYFLPADKQAYIAKVLGRHNFRVNEAALARLSAEVDPHATTADSAWAVKITPATRKQALYGVLNQTVTVGNWIDSVNRYPQFRALPLSEQGIRSSIETFAERPALLAEAQGLEQRDPKYKHLMEEFRDGLLIFKLTDKTVWGQMNDSARSRQFFDSHRDQYKTLPKVGLSEIFLYKEDEAKSIAEEVRDGSTPFDTLAATHTQRSGYRDRAGRWDESNAQNSDLVRVVLDTIPHPSVGTIIGPIKYQNGWSIIRINSYVPPHQMDYDEARLEGAFIDDMRAQLEKEWVDSLHDRYDMSIDEGSLDDVIAYGDQVRQKQAEEKARMEAEQKADEQTSMRSPASDGGSK